MEECKSMTAPMNVKEKFCKDDGADKVDEAKFDWMSDVPHSYKT